ncbi:hypothetical protein ACN28E_24060 [Archangium lansingense]|uniref:hypothetical protein n=1 Tax=Archangium lansingense TaxID=2995310 RepID=UPI003B7DF99E
MLPARVSTFHLLRIALLGLSLSACQTAAPAVAPDSPPDAAPTSVERNSASAPAEQLAQPVRALNELFHQQYASARTDYVSRLGTEERPVLLMKGSLTLMWRGQRTQYSVFSSRYHTLKAISHVPLSIYVALPGNAGSTLAPETQARFQSTRQRIAEALATLDDPASSTRRVLPPELLEEQRTLLRESDTLLAESLSRGRPSPERLEQFVQAVRPALVANARAAARDELAQLHQHVSAIRASLSPAQWARLVVVISSSRQARAREVSLQYFERLLREPKQGEGASREERIVVVEAFGSREPLEALATHELDQDAAAGLLGDKFRLQSDLLAPYATEYLDELLPSTAPGLERH